MNTSYEKLSFYNTFFGGSIEGDNIVSTDFYGNKQIVGVTSKKYQETVDLLNTYYNKLVDLGIIEKEKTPEEIAKEQQEMMSMMMSQMKAMQEKLDSMQERENIKEGNYYEHKSISTEPTKVEYESKPKEQVGRFNKQSKRNDKLCEQSSRSIEQC